MGENLLKQSKRQGELRHFILWGVRKVSELGVLFFGSFVFFIRQTQSLHLGRVLGQMCMCTGKILYDLALMKHGGLQKNKKQIAINII